MSAATRRRLLLALLGAAWVWPLTTPLVDRADSLGYLAPAISIATDGDLLYLDEYRELEMNSMFFRPTPAGLVGNHWNVGLGLALLPTYRLASWLASGGGTLSGAVLAAIQATSLLWAGALLWLLARLGSEREGGEAARAPSTRGAIVAAAVYIGTPLVFYAHVQSARPHLLEALLSTLLFVVFLRCRRVPRVADWLLLGLISGAALLVRAQAAAMAVVPLGELALCGLAAARAPAGRRVWRDLALAAAALIAPLVVAAVASAHVSQLLYGDAGSPSLLDAVLQVDTDILRSLVHPHHGLLAWSPVLVLALAGLVRLTARDRRLGMLIWAAIALQLWLNGTIYEHALDHYEYTRHWAGGGAFGGRRWLCAAPFFALGIGEAAAWATTRWARAVALAVTALAVAWNGLLAAQARAVPYEVCEQMTTWPGLVAHVIAPLRAPSEVVVAWVRAAPRPADAVVGQAVAAALAAVATLGWWGARRLSPRARAVALLAVSVAAVVAGGMGIAALAARTRAAAAAAAPDLAAFRQEAEARTPSLAYRVLVDQARVRAGTGDPAGALERYERAFEIGLGSSAVSEYLQLSLAREGSAVARRRLERLERAHPGHPVFRPLRRAPGQGASPLFDSSGPLP